MTWILQKEFLLAGSTLEGPVAIVALDTFRLSFTGTLTIANEVQNYFHLLCEAQWFDFNGLPLAMCRTLLRFNRNLEEHLKKHQRKIYRVIKFMQENALKPVVPLQRHGYAHLLAMCFSIQLLFVANV